MKRIILLVIVSSIAFSGLVAAETPTPTATDTTNATAPDSAPDNAALVIDSQTVVVDYSVQNGEMVIDLYSTEYKTVSFGPSPSSGSETGTIQSQTHVVAADQTTTVRIASPEGVTIWTNESVTDGRFHYISPSGYSLFGSSTFTGSDVRNAGIGGAIGVAIAVLYEAVSAKIGSSERGERVA